MAEEGLTLTPDGQVYITTDPPGAGSFFAGGYAFNSSGQLHVTTTQTAGDYYIGGRRFAPNGALIVGTGLPPERPYFYNNGLPYRKTDGALVRQENQTPNASDPYVHGIRVGPLGGVYFITSALPPEEQAPPVISSPVDVGILVTATPAVVSGGATKTAQRWLIDAVQVSTAVSYTPVPADFGKQLDYEETWTNSGGSIVVYAVPQLVKDDIPYINWDFLTGVLPSALTFARGSVATFFDAAGVMQTASANVARFDHDPLTLQALGLLIEESRTNSFLNSEVPVTQNVTVTNTSYVLSFYGAGSIDISGAHTATLVGSGPYPNRVSLTFTPTAGTLTLTVTGDVQKAQLEAGAWLTSYIQTTAATATRTTESCLCTGASFNFYNQVQGTTQVDFQARSGITISKYLQGFGTLVPDAFTNLQAITTGSAENLFYISYVGAVAQPSLTFGSYTPNTLQKVAGSYGGGEIRGAMNGVAKTPQTITQPGTIDRMGLGCSYNGGGPGGFWIQHFRYWQTPKTTAELQAITS